MDNLDIRVLRTLRDWRKAEERALLATVVRTWGSSPRPTGSLMAMRGDGAVVGSVSGGCIEDDLIAQHVDRAGPADRGPPLLVRYGVSAEEAHRFGLPCGGTLELLLEFDPDAAALDRLVRSLERGQLVRRTVQLADGAVSLDPAFGPEPMTFGAGAVTLTFGPGWRMLLIGAGQLAEYIATIALFNGFAVTVCDPRQQHRHAWSVPGVCVDDGMPDDVVAAAKADVRTCVVGLTHDPKLDDLALLQALESPAFYIGAIGSRKNNEARRRRLAEHFDVGEDALERLRGPIGVYIGSRTPAEIAVSVMAEILAARNGVHLPAEVRVERAKNAMEPC